jgi:small subunit ribosomal protein S6
MKKQYECLFIVSSAAKDETRKGLIEKFAKMTGDAAIKIDLWGLKRFATPIDHKVEGFYVLFNFVAEAEIPAKMGDLMNITDGIVRFMFICKDEIKPRKVKAKKTKTDGGKE